MNQFQSVDLSGHDFSGQDLTGCDFSGSNLRGALFFKSILRDADFTTAKNLNSAQFGGADLSGASFPHEHTFPGLVHTGDVTQNTKTVFFLMLLGNVVAWLTVANVSDGALIGNATRSTLPIIESDISIARFFLFAPVILLLVHAYFVVHLQRVWEEVTLLPAIFPDGHSVVRRLPNWLPIGIVRIFFEHLKGRRPPLIFLQISAVVITVWLLQPFTMVLFGARYLITRDLVGLCVLVLLFFLAAMLSACSFVLTKHTLQGDFRHLVRQSSNAGIDNSDGGGKVGKTYFYGFVIALIPSLIFLFGALDYRSDFGITRNFENTRIMQLLGFRYTAMIRETNLSHSQLDLSGRDLFEARFLDSEFSNGDFSGTDLSRAYLMRSQFDDVRFDGAIFDEVYVNGTSFRSTSFDLSERTTFEERSGRYQDHGFSGELMNSCLYRSYWTGDIEATVFFNNSFRDAVFQQVEMTKVFFTSSDLQGASFRKPRFDTVYFTKSNLQGALFESVHGGYGNSKATTIFDSRLVGAYFRDVKTPVVIRQSNAEGATFEGDVSGLRFVDSNLRGADFAKAKKMDISAFKNVCTEDANFPDDFVEPESQCQSWDPHLVGIAKKFEIEDVCEATWVEQNVVGDLEHGSIVVKESECVGCHDGNDAIGPPLQNLIGKVSGSSIVFDQDRYSESIRGMSIPWDKDTLDLYLRSPDRLIPGNRMRIVGIRDPVGRKKVVDWLQSRSTP